MSTITTEAEPANNRRDLAMKQTKPTPHGRWRDFTRLSHRRQRRTQMLVAVGMLALPIVAMPQSASAASGWFDGNSTSQWFANCFGEMGYVQSYTGYLADLATDSPMTGERYYGHVVVAIVGNPCAGGEFAATDIVLPPDTDFDFGTDQWGRPRCFYTSGVTGKTSEETNDPSLDCDVYGGGYSGNGRSLGE